MKISIHTNFRSNFNMFHNPYLLCYLSADSGLIFAFHERETLHFCQEMA